MHTIFEVLDLNHVPHSFEFTGQPYQVRDEFLRYARRRDVAVVTVWNADGIREFYCDNTGR
jgi:hypothetical protein